MQIRTSAVPPFMKNGFLVVCENTSEAVLIDPGDDAHLLMAAVDEMKARVQGILLTHAHVDHVTGVAKVKAATGAPVWLHREDLFLYDAAIQQGLFFGVHVDPQPQIDHFYQDGEPVRFGQYVVEVLHTPGHCPGGVCLAIGSTGSQKRELFVGDTLFAGSIGRTDLPGGDYATLITSIRKVLFAFSDDTVVHPGHGPDTTIGRERRTNPFLA